MSVVPGTFVVSPCRVVHATCRYEEPDIEDLYRIEQELARIGKTRSAAKIRPLREEVVSMIKLSDFNMETVDWDEEEEEEVVVDGDVDGVDADAVDVDEEEEDMKKLHPALAEMVPPLPKPSA
jgi:hypothetical protein